VIAATCGTNAAAWAVGAAALDSHLPAWPAYAFGAMAALGAYVVIAALARWWPLHRLLLPPPELLDQCIREGHRAREEVRGYRGEDPIWEPVQIAARWTLITSGRLENGYPALFDAFWETTAPVPITGGKSSMESVIDAKLAVLTKTRRTMN
jgi:hypothetical protein